MLLAIGREEKHGRQGKHSRVDSRVFLVTQQRVSVQDIIGRVILPLFGIKFTKDKPGRDWAVEALKRGQTFNNAAYIRNCQTGTCT